MVKLKTITAAAHLRDYTHLVSWTRNMTLWSSTFYIVERYRDIRAHLSSVVVDDVDITLLSKRENDEVEKLVLRLQDRQSKTKALKSDFTTLS